MWGNSSRCCPCTGQQTISTWQTGGWCYQSQCFSSSLLGLIVYLGMMVGAVMLGDLADKLGRKKCLIISLAINAAFAFLSSFVQGYGFFLFCRLISGLGCVTGELSLYPALISSLLVWNHFPLSCHSRPTSVGVTFPFNVNNPIHMTLKKTLIFPMCYFFFSVLGDPSPSCLPISLNSCLVRRGGSTWAGCACSGWSVVFLLQRWLGASSHITVMVLCFWLLTAPLSCTATPLQKPTQVNISQTLHIQAWTVLKTADTSSAHRRSNKGTDWLIDWC